VFDGDCEKIAEYLDALDATTKSKLGQTAQNETIEFLHHLGDKITKPLLNLLTGYQIKRRRKELGINTMDFADALGSSQTVVNGFERGARGIGGSRLYKISKILNVDMAYFYGDTSKTQPNTITDITTHTINQLILTLPEEDKEYLLDFTRGFINHKRRTSQSEK